MTLTKDEIQDLLNGSIWTQGTASENLANDRGEFISSITEKTKLEYIQNVQNWLTYFRDIVRSIGDFADDYTIDNRTLQQVIESKINSVEVVREEVIKNTTGNPLQPGSRTPFFTTNVHVRRGQTLYRYTDDEKNHVFANPNYSRYGRFTDPEREQSVFYLAFDKDVARREVRGTNSTHLLTYEVIDDFDAQIIPGAMKSYNNYDDFFVERLRKFHNLIFSLQSSASYFKNVQNVKRLNTGIYITTNILYTVLRSKFDGAIIYPSTKVTENGYLGRVDNNDYFSPTKTNADIAIFDDVNYENNKAYSKYVRLKKE